MKRPSGKFNIRLSSEEHGRLKLESFKRGISLNELCQEKLSGRSDSTGLLPSDLSGVTLDELLKTAKQIDAAPIGVVLFGSFSRNEQRENSDVDLLFVVPKSVVLERSLYLKWDLASQELQRKSAHELSVHFSHLPESPAAAGPAAAGSIWLECAMDGKLLYEVSDSNIQKTLLDIRRLIAEGRWRRQYAYGLPYWVKEQP